MISKKYKIVNKNRFYLFITFNLAVLAVIIFTFLSNIRVHSAFLEAPYIEIIVAEGDTLWDISKEYLPSKYDIRKMIHNISEINDIEAGYVYPGDVLKVPVIKR